MWIKVSRGNVSLLTIRFLFFFSIFNWNTDNLSYDKNINEAVNYWFKLLAQFYTSEKKKIVLTLWG